MKLAYTAATLELCLDLTDPDARSVTVGSIVLGQAGEARYATLVTAAVPGPELGKVDPLTRDLLNNISTVLKKKVGSAVERTGFDLEQILQYLNRSMMGSLHVGQVEPKESEEVPDDATGPDLMFRLLRLAFDHLDDARDGVRTDTWRIAAPSRDSHATM